MSWKKVLDKWKYEHNNELIGDLAQLHLLSYDTIGIARTSEEKAFVRDSLLLNDGSYWLVEDSIQMVYDTILVDVEGFTVPGTRHFGYPLFRIITLKEIFDTQKYQGDRFVEMAEYYLDLIKFDYDIIRLNWEYKGVLFSAYSIGSIKADQCFFDPILSNLLISRGFSSFSSTSNQSNVYIPPLKVKEEDDEE